MKKLKIVTIVLVIVACIIYLNTNNPDKYYNDSRQILEEGAPLASEMGLDAIIDDGNRVYGEFCFSGGLNIYAIDPGSDSKVNIKYSLTTETGMGKLVLVTAKDEIITLVENIDPTTNNGTTQIEVPAGHNRIKLICKDKARGEIDFLVE